jgi:hypothetical protein
LTWSSNGLKGHKEGLLLRGDPPPLAHRAVHNFYKVMAQHAMRVGGRTCMGML